MTVSFADSTNTAILFFDVGGASAYSCTVRMVRRMTRRCRRRQPARQLLAGNVQGATAPGRRHPAPWDDLRL